MSEPTKDVLKAIRKARCAMHTAANLCADMDAEIATYWKQDGNSTPTWWQSKDIRKLSDVLYSMILGLESRAQLARRGKL